MTKLSALGSLVYRHPRSFVLAWLAILVIAFAVDHALGGSYVDTQTLPGTPSQQGAELLAIHGADGGRPSGQVVFEAAHGPLTGGQKSSIEASRERLLTVPHVVGVAKPVLSKIDPQIAYSTIEFSGDPSNFGTDFVEEVEAATQPAKASGIDVDLGGTIGQAARPKAKDGASELIGLVLALCLLLITFGSVLGAFLPILSAILGVAAGLGVLGSASALTSFPTVSPTLATMMGLGVGIDYALFLTTRYRQRLIDGEDPGAAVAATLETSGHAVTVAGATVILAMCGLYASGIGFIGRLGLSAAIAVAIAAAAALTLAPAFMSLLGRRIDRRTVRRPVAESPASGSGWQRYAAALARHPVGYAAAGIALLAILAIPTLSMRLGHVSAGEQPAIFTERRAYDAISAGFGEGANGPLEVVAGPFADSTASARTGDGLRDRIARLPDVREVSPTVQVADGSVVTATVFPRSGPDSSQTATLKRRLQDDVLPDALRGTEAHGYVTGSTAAQIDFKERVSSRLAQIIAVVLAGAFLILLFTFRSPLLAAKAAILNLLSIGASYGILVAVFQWGWGVSLLGLSGPVSIESYIPMIVFAIVFGLSMDYEVFLLTRVREHWLAGRDNEASVGAGLAETGRVISCAAAIMAIVFFAFLLSPNIVVKMIALGLGASVLIDATIIRLLVVPSLMFLFGRANWWAPRWLGGSGDTRMTSTLLPDQGRLDHRSRHLTDPKGER